VRIDQGEVKVCPIVGQVRINVQLERGVACPVKLEDRGDEGRLALIRWREVVGAVEDDSLPGEDGEENRQRGEHRNRPAECAPDAAHPAMIWRWLVQKHAVWRGRAARELECLPDVGARSI